MLPLLIVVLMDPLNERILDYAINLHPIEPSIGLAQTNGSISFPFTLQELIVVPRDLPGLL